MKTLIVCQSESHGNTRKIGEVFSKHFKAALLEPDQVNLTELGQYDLIGFGSGIKYSNFYKKLRKFIDRIPEQDFHNSFLFATSGFKKVPFKKLEKVILKKGFKNIGTFSCQAFDTWFPFKILFGGLNKNRPNENDLAEAKKFCDHIQSKIN